MTTGKMLTAVIIVILTALAYAHGMLSTPMAWVVILGLLVWGHSIPVRR